MQRNPGELTPTGETVSGLDDVSVVRADSPQARHSFTQADQVDQLVTASEAERRYWDSWRGRGRCAVCPGAILETRRNISV